MNRSMKIKICEDDSCNSSICDCETFKFTPKGIALLEELEHPDVSDLMDLCYNNSQTRSLYKSARERRLEER